MIAKIADNYISFLFRWRQSAREEDLMQGPRQPPPQQKRPPRDLNVPTTGRPTQAMVRLSSASNIAETQRMPDTQNKTARLRGVIWRRYTLLRSKRSTHHMRSGLGRWTLDYKGVWEWTDGSTFDFSYWMSGQPDGGSKYDYGVMDCLYSTTGEWSILYFGYKHDYICQLTL